MNAMGIVGAAGLLAGYFSTRRWLRERELKPAHRYGCRGQVHAAVAEAVPEPTCYLALGGVRNAALALWPERFRHERSRLRWSGPEPGGALAPPTLDRRVRPFRVQLGCTLSAHRRACGGRHSLVVHFGDSGDFGDALVLCCLYEARPFLERGAVLVFDRFLDRFQHREPMADFLEHGRVSVECFAATTALASVAFKVRWAGA